MMPIIPLCREGTPFIIIRAEEGPATESLTSAMFKGSDLKCLRKIVTGDKTWVYCMN